ncbi:MAG: hypothetical protein AAFR07_15960 [Pseudomonadota bacterium]
MPKIGKSLSIIVLIAGGIGAFAYLDPFEVSSREGMSADSFSPTGNGPLEKSPPRATQPEDRPIKSSDAGDNSAPVYSPREVDFQVPAPIDSIGPEYARLVEEAEAGSSTAAFTLFTSLDRCKSAFSSSSEIEQALSSMDDAGRLTLESGQVVTLGANVDAALLEETLREQTRFCEGLSLEPTAADPLPWLLRAADQGYLPAVGRAGWYMRNNGRGTTAEQAQRFEQAFATGISHAALGLYEVYIDEEGTGLANDPAKAAGYLGAFIEIMDDMQGGQREGPSGRYLQERERELTSVIEGLSGPERARVRLQTQTNLDAIRPFCCVQ